MLIWLIAAVLVFWIVKFRVKRRRMYELASRIPGPREELPVIGVAHTLMGNTEDIMTTLQHYSYESHKCDGIIKIWLNHLLYFLITNPMDLEFILKSCLEKDDLHRFVRKVTGNGGIFAPVSIWRERRKVIAPVFIPKNINDFVEVLSEHSEKLTKCLESQANAGDFSVWPYLSRFTLDSICETTLGVKLNSQENSDSVICEAIDNISNLICEMIFHLWLQLDWLYKLLPQHVKHQKCIEIIHSFIDKAIKTKIKELKIERGFKTKADSLYGLDSYRRPTFLNHYISSSNSSKGYTNIELREEMVTLMIAGMDTSANTIGFVMKLLAKYPHVQEKAYLELQTVFDNSNRPLVKEDLDKLQYLECVIKETLRLFPPVPFITRKILEDIHLPSRRILPAGSGAAISIWGVHRDPMYWGPDVECFDPDRFLPGRFKLPYPCCYMPFSSGPRNCVGYRYAMMSMKTCLSAILRKFRIVADKETGATPNIRVKMDISLKAVDGYRVALQKRKP